MKLFRQLLVAPAALGLLAPLAANAAEVNLDNVVDYVNPSAAVATTAQFSDVVPGDWAYTALQNLSESYGCVDNAYTHNLKNGQALTRYEAAALVNACLDGGLMANGEGLSLDASRLADEFGSEMAILKGRIDGLETKINEFQAGQFSSTTKMSGGAVFTLGAVDASPAGEADNTENLAMQYAFGIDLNTSFTGQDDLYIGLEAGNAADPLQMDSAVTSTTTNVPEIHALYYTFPVGDFSVTAGPMIDQEDIVSATVSTYSDAFRLGGQPYSLANTERGPGAGVTYTHSSGLNASFAFVADNGEDASAGILTEEGDDVVTYSLGFDAENFGGGIIFSSGDNQASAEDYDSIGYGLYFQPEGLPSINLSYDTKDPQTGNDQAFWMLASDYEVGPGTLSAAYSVGDDDGSNELEKYELYYSYEMADGVTIQPGIFVEDQIEGDSFTGFVVETFFRF